MILFSTLVGPVGLIAFCLIWGLCGRPLRFKAITFWVGLNFAWTLILTPKGLIHGHWPAIFVTVTNFVALTSAWDSERWLAEHPHVASNRYYAWWAVFWAALLGIALSQNLALSWLSVELSTLASAALITELGHRHALEAAWKYLVIASVGLILALIGIVFVYASLHGPQYGWAVLNDQYITAHSSRIAPVIRELATIFIVAGFGTKAGLVPFHTWLPDAHSESPSPVSGMLSGVLLGLSLFVAVQFVHMVPIRAQLEFNGSTLLTIFGTLSMTVGSLALLVQKDIKRLLAYSSIEQVGIMAVGSAIGTSTATVAVLWQFVLHAVIKSFLFYGAGHLSIRYGTQQLNRITALTTQNLAFAVFWGLGILALAGLPPLGLAYSEWFILAQLWGHHAYFVMAVALSALTLTFSALAYHLIQTLWQPIPFPLDRSLNRHSEEEKS